MLEIQNKYKNIIDKFIIDIITSTQNKKGIDITLYNAMYYVLSSGGQRLRASILLHVADALKVDFDVAIVAAISLELLHNYTLVHDDLPSMDDDDMRRGIPSCHMKFGEGVAILTGNALFTLALQVLIDGLSQHNNMLFKIMQVLLNSIGICGVLSGQSLDIKMRSHNMKSDTDIIPILDMYYLKTGKLFEAAFIIPCILANIDANKQEILGECGGIFGIIYQIADDLADNTSMLDISIKDSLIETFNNLIDSTRLPSSSIALLTQLIADL